uniref:Uncharacterized protein n=1 Tax=Setaria viridis TaxID=4556 RepID=A0A4U6SVT4_SETVI|nr:hypothetical protein SEVIR_9G148832v2 [Setaria viridis]
MFRRYSHTVVDNYSVDQARATSVADVVSKTISRSVSIPGPHQHRRFSPHDTIYTSTIENCGCRASHHGGPKPLLE